MREKILITGATGFVGSALIKRLQSQSMSLRAAVLEGENSSHLPPEVQQIITPSLSETSDYSSALDDINIVIHLAARVHIMHDAATDPLQEFRKVNLHGTERLARQAAKAGVKRFVFISSIKVVGEESSIPYTPDSTPRPSDPYGISKWEAEKALRRIEIETGLEVVVVRPTLVYGPGVKANFLNMMIIIARGIPLPFASIINKRSIIYVDNLVDALATCAVHPTAAGNTYLVSDCDDVSTSELIRRTASALGVSPLLFPFPPSLMRIAGSLTRRTSAVNRLLGSLTVDSSKIRRELGWKPPFTMEEGLRTTAEWFNKRKS